MKPKEQPPRWANRFLRWYCPVLLLEEIEGDLYENFYRNLKRKGVRSARRRYIIDTIRFCNPVTFRRAKARRPYYSSSINTTIMLRSFFIAAIRNLRKNRAYTTINVLGLAVGIACCMIIFVIVRYETSFDDYHSKAERIYRVNLNQQTSDGRMLSGNNYSPLAEAVRDEVTGLEAVTGVFCLQIYQINKEDAVFEDKYAFFVDQYYFDVFDGVWIVGNEERALKAPNTVVVTDAFARKFLGGIDKAMGSTFMLENRVSLTVTGIVQQPPTNTDHPYTMLISYPTLAEFVPESEDNWETVGGGATYVVFREETRPDQIYPQFNHIIQTFLLEDLAKNTDFYLMPLNDNHDRNYDYTSFTYDFPMPIMIIMSIVVGMIAFIACINFINLATAQSLKRAKEVGIRKTMGSSRIQLIIQYMSEALVITLLAVVVALALAKVGMLRINAQYGGNYLQFDFIKEPSVILFLAGVTLLITLLAGFYPAFVLSGYRPVWALSSQRFTGKGKRFTLRKGLVVTQFVGAQLLILVTFIMIHQINHFRERPLGFDPEEVVVLPYLLDNDDGQYTKLNHALAQVPGIISQTFASGPAGPTSSVQSSEFYGEKGKAYAQRGLLNYGDAEYLNTFDLELLAGSNFPLGQIHASSEVLVNEILATTLGFESPEAAIGAIYTVQDQEVKIRGVFEDYFTRPMSTKVDPVTLQFDPEQVTGVVMKISTDNVPETLAGVENAWKSIYPNYLCRYRFLDELLNRQYGEFNDIFSFLGTASFLAIFIGCLGLYGLVSFMAVQRTKEIGIRKVLGATVSNIMVMFTKELLLLIVVAFVIAAPSGYFLGQLFLIELPERVDPHFSLFALTLVASVGIALLTVCYRSFRAAVQNPIHSLRDE
uniref:Permease prefix domain 2-containing transporter n=1 Tax=Roseihalotalea indica TaxID=2867963 RepID=A0AA49GK78_9BACT|nr:permease prefix domain 2-containing transporter [Tunicatimonas sp. TK19036]